MLHELNFKPFEYQFKFKTQLQKTYIFDRVRKKYIQLTPEEWVRQHVISFLMEEKGVGPGLISIEKGTKYNNLLKRYDLKVYDTKLNVLLLVECKAHTVRLTEETLFQSLTYAKADAPKYIMLSNGLHHIFYDYESQSFIKDFNLFKH